MAASDAGLPTAAEAKQWKRPGNLKPEAKTAQLAPNPHAKATTAIAGTGVIEVLVKPWGTVFIDGVKRGNTPTTRTMTVSAGQHTITVRHPTLREVFQTILVDAGDHDKLRIDLSPRL